MPNTNEDQSHSRNPETIPISRNDPRIIRGWFNPADVLPPGGSSNPKQLEFFASEFLKDGHWDYTKPALLAFQRPIDKAIMLLTGQNRFAAAWTTGTFVPIVIVPYAEVARAHTNIVLQRALYGLAEEALDRPGTDFRPAAILGPATINQPHVAN
jgi:hypothetical protein